MLGFERIIYLAAICVVVLGIITGYLARQNWNDKLLGQLVSILVIGIATAFVTIVLSLKDIQWEKALKTSVVVDIESQRIAQSDGSNGFISVLEQRQRNLQSLFAGSSQLHENDCWTTEQLPDAIGQMILSGLLFELFDLQNPSDMGNMPHGKTPGTYVQNFPRYVPYTLKRKEPIDESLRTHIIESLPLLDPTRIRQEFARINPSLPPGTRVRFWRHNRGIYAYAVGFTIEKPNFFSFDVRIEPFMSGVSSLDLLPGGLALRSGRAPSWRVYGATVIIKTTHAKMTSAGAESDDYQKWLVHNSQFLIHRWSTSNDEEQFMADAKHDADYCQ